MGGVVRLVERRVHGIGWVLIVGLLEVRGEVIPVGAEDIETGSCAHVVRISALWASTIAKAG